MAELRDNISYFLSEWQGLFTEKSRTYSLDSDRIEEEQLPELLNDIEDLSKSFDPGRVNIKVDAGEDRYDIDWDVDLGTIQSGPVSGVDYEINSLYTDDEIRDAVRNLDNDRLRDIKGLINSLSVLIGRDDIDIDVEFGIEKSGITERIEDELNIHDVNVQFYFSFDFFEVHLSGIAPEEFRNEFLSANSRLMLIVHEADILMYNDDFAIVGLELIDDLSDWLQRDKTNWQSEFESVATQSLIENISEVYVPPSFFVFNSDYDGEYRPKVENLFRGHIILFSILSLSSNAQQDDYKWTVQISGKQLIQGQIKVVSNRILIHNADKSNRTFDLDGLSEDEFHTLFNWIFVEGGESETRVPIARNVTTLFAQNFSDVIDNISEILGSVKSNYQYYLEQSTDDFFEFRQELIDSAFETNSRFSELRSQLIDGLSRDIFRTIAFILVIGATVYYQTPEDLDSSTAFTILLTLMLIYGLVVIRRIRGFHNQIDRLVEDRQASVDFYSRFFDKSEQEDLRLDSGVDDVRLQGILDCLGWTNGEFEFEYTLAYDLLVYYILMSGIMVGSLIGLIDIHLYNLIGWFPP